MPRIGVAYCGICGSDLHEYIDGPHAIPVTEPHPLSGRRAPLTSATSSAARWSSRARCGGSRRATARRGGAGLPLRHLRVLRSGDYNLCRHVGFVGLMGDGGMADSGRRSRVHAARLPDAVSFEQAAVFEPAAVALHAVRRSSLEPGDACVVFGMGPVGLLIVAMLRLCGAGEIVAVDVNPARLAFAGAMGATRVVDASREDAAGVVLGTTAERGAALAFEAAGVQASLDAALGCLRKGGEAVLVGLMGRAQIDVFDIVNRELRLTSSVGYRHVHPTLIDWTARGRIDPAAIVTRKVALHDALPLGFEALLNDASQIKVLVAPRGVEEPPPKCTGA